MIGETCCKYCKVYYEVVWDDEADAYYEEVEDTDYEYTDHDSDVVPEYCPFCGTHATYDGIAESE